MQQALGCSLHAVLSILDFQGETECPILQTTSHLYLVYTYALILPGPA